MPKKHSCSFKNIKMGKLYASMAVMVIKILMEELCNLCTLRNIVMVIKSRKMRWGGHVAHVGEMKNTYKILIGTPEGKRPL
jgi:hypothetical protein